jgi:hypothetical protein
MARRIGEQLLQILEICGIVIARTSPYDPGKMKKILLSFVCLSMSAMVFAEAAPAEKLAQPETPDAIKAPATDVVAFALNAKGVQIYECRAKKDDPTKFEWVFKAPEADLFDAQGKKVGRHYGGPTWESNDGSKVVGEVKGKADAKDPTGVPWLLLNAKSHEGSGAFAGVTSIQRVNTVGGKAPANGCDQTTAGKELRAPYSAVYYFYTRKP